VAGSPAIPPYTALLRPFRQRRHVTMLECRHVVRSETRLVLYVVRPSVTSCRGTPDVTRCRPYPTTRVHHHRYLSIGRPKTVPSPPTVAPAPASTSRPQFSRYRYAAIARRRSGSAGSISSRCYVTAIACAERTYARVVSSSGHCCCREYHNKKRIYLKMTLGVMPCSPHVISRARSIFTRRIYLC